MRFSVGVLIAAITHGCGGEKSATPALGSGTGSSVLTSAPRVPVLADAGPGAPASSADAAFTAEQRDEAWAPETEAELTRRWRSIRGAKVAELECRSSQCKLVLAGSQAEVGQTIADLEGHRGLHGYAKNVVLGRPTRKPDGSVELSIYTVWGR